MEESLLKNFRDHFRTSKTREPNLEQKNTLGNQSYILAYNLNTCCYNFPPKVDAVPLYINIRAPNNQLCINKED